MRLHWIEPDHGTIVAVPAEELGRFDEASRRSAESDSIGEWAVELVLGPSRGLVFGEPFRTALLESPAGTIFVQGIAVDDESTLVEAVTSPSSDWRPLSVELECDGRDWWFGSSNENSADAGQIFRPSPGPRQLEFRRVNLDGTRALAFRLANRP